MVAAFFFLSLWLQHEPCTTVVAIERLLLETVWAIVDNVGASAPSTDVGNSFLDHTDYLTITSFSSTTTLKTTGRMRSE